MRAFAQQKEIEIGEDRGEAKRIFELHDMIAKAHPQMITRRAIGKPTSEQPGVVDVAKVAEAALVVYRGDRNGIREEDTHDRTVGFNVRTEIAKRVGMTPFNDRIGFRRKRGHASASSQRDRMRKKPASGTRTQSGRWASSYSIS